MRKFFGRDGTVYQARDEQELVARLHATALTKSANDLEFMAGMAERIELATGRPCRSDTPANFVADLIAIGIVTEKQR